MLTFVFLSLAAAAQGQFPYPPAVQDARTVRIPITQVVQPVDSGSGRLQASHFRSGPYPPALPSIEGGDISPVEQDSPRVDHPTYSLPSLSSPGLLRAPTQSYPVQPEQYRSPVSYPTQYSQSPYLPSPSLYPVQKTKPHPYQLGTVGPSSHPTKSYLVAPNQVSPTSSYPNRPGQFPSPETLSKPQRPVPFQSGGEVSPDELEIPPNSQIMLQDKRLQYSHGFSDDKGTAVREQGSLLSTNDGWEYVIAKKGSYSYTSPEGKLISVNYIADDKGFRLIP